MTRRVMLSVNGEPIELDYFVQSFIDHTLGSMVEALEGTGEIKTLALSIEANSVTVCLNGTVVPTNTFVKKIIRNTVFGMVSSLKGVGEIERLNIGIERGI